MERLINNRGCRDLSECTMSQIRQTELNSVKQRLMELSGCGIFGRVSNQHWTRAYQVSYDLMEAPDAPWPTVQALRTAVRKRLPKELPYITEREESLLKRMILFGGTAPLMAEDDMIAAETLIRRLWCSCVVQDNGPIYVRLARPLMMPVLKCLSSQTYQETRLKMYALTATLHSMLYLHGVLYADPAIQQLSGHLTSGQDEAGRRVLYRFLRAEFDYCQDRQGNLVLVHPGVAQPEKMMAALSGPRYQAADYAREMIVGGIGEELREESAATDMLRAELSETLQPGMNAGSMVDDVKILIKQGATHEQLMELMQDKLATQMNTRLENALRKVEMDTVRWQTAPSRRLN